MSFHVIECFQCGYIEERYYSQSTDAHCSRCGNFLNGEQALTSEEFYAQLNLSHTIHLLRPMKLAKLPADHPWFTYQDPEFK